MLYKSYTVVLILDEHPVYISLFSFSSEYDLDQSSIFDSKTCPFKAAVVEKVNAQMSLSYLASQYLANFVSSYECLVCYNTIANKLKCLPPGEHRGRLVCLST
jgi:hypothetical protein